MERRAGMSLTAEDGVERLRTRVSDRAGDHYEEMVLNPDGSVFHHSSEPLSKHEGGGR